MSKPIEPLPPESSSRGPRGVPSAHPEKFKQIEEILRIGEAELDQQRKRSFTRPHEEEGELETTETRAPSPFESEFHRPLRTMMPSPPLGFSELESNAIPNPETSPPPQLNMAAPPPPLPSQEPELPQAEQFWEEFDLPDQPPEPMQFEEGQARTVRRETQTNEPTTQKAAGRTETKKKEPSSTDQAGKKIKKEAKPSLASLKNKWAKEEMGEALPSAPEPWKPLKREGKPLPGQALPSKKANMEPEQAPAWQPPPPKTGKGRQPLSDEQLEEMRTAPSQEELIPSASAPKKKGEAISPDRPGVRKEKETPKIKKEPRLWEEQPSLTPGQLREREERGKQKPSAEAASVQPPDPLPANSQRVAQIVQTASTPYLTAQTSALFYQMVGTIVFMTSSKTGISTTEVVLNTPAFQNSVFYNTTIQIEKYASAPDSFNIRLTGTPEAIKVFNSNIENLTTAFTLAYEDRRVSFRIGRLETALAPERHLIRRKKEGGGKEDFGRGQDET